MKKMTQKEFCNIVTELGRCEYIVLGNYQNSLTKIKMKHNACGYEYEVKPNGFIHDNNRCPKCMNKIKVTTSMYKERVYKLVGCEYSVMGNYTRSSDRILMKHNSCGYEYYVESNSFIQGKRCPKCAGKIRNKSSSYFKQEIKNLVGDEYIVLGEYVNNKNKITFNHISCGHIFNMRPNNFLTGNRCPYCKESKGEKTIKDILASVKIDFLFQYKFKDCKNKNSLPFDFAILNTDKTVKGLIEFDGEQHFNGWGGRKDTLLRIQINDAIKNKYCIQNNIPLLRIKYTDFDNISQILSLFIVKLNKDNVL